MAEISKLRAVLQPLLTAKCTRAYYEIANKETTYPYVVYSIKSWTSSEVIDQLELEVFCVDKAQDTTTLETLADSIWTEFDHKYHIDTDMEFALYQNTRNNVQAEDKSLHIRHLVFSLRVC